MFSIVVPLSVFRFCIEKFTPYEALTNLCTLSFTYGTTCIHKSLTFDVFVSFAAALQVFRFYIEQFDSNHMIKFMYFFFIITPP